MKKIFYLSVIVLATLAIHACSEYDYTERENRVLSEDLKAQLEDSADAVFSRTSTPGLIALISVEGEPDLIIRRGVSNISTNEPMDEKNWFRIASNTKTFTGTAVLKLVDERRISLDSTISFYLPEYKIPQGDKITVRMLGNMTSGLFNYSDDPGLWDILIKSNFTATIPPDSLLALAFRYPLKFKPGTSYEYCNTNIVLLGLLIERVTGKPAWEVIREKVVDPLHLTNTYWGGPFFLQTPYSHGYTTIESLVDATNFNPSWGYTAGAMVSNMHDMKIWAKAVAEGRLLSARMKEERLNWGPGDYGFCLERIVYRQKEWIGHPGSIPGYNSMVFYCPEKKITLVMYSNTDDNLPAQDLLISYIKTITDNTTWRR